MENIKSGMIHICSYGTCLVLIEGNSTNCVLYRTSRTEPLGCNEAYVVTREESDHLLFVSSVRLKLPNWCRWVSLQPQSSTRGEPRSFRSPQAPRSWTNCCRVGTVHTEIVRASACSVVVSYITHTNTHTHIPVTPHGGKTSCCLFCRWD